MKSAMPPVGDVWGRARYAVRAIETRWRTGAGWRQRCATRRLARRAVHELGELVAAVALHLPYGTRRQRAAEHAIVGKVLKAMARACGCSSCAREL